MTKYALFLLAFLLLWNPEANSQTVGAEIEYECLNACTVRVRIKAYRNCEGFTSLNPYSFSFVSNGGSCTAPVPVADWDTVSIREVTWICPDSLSYCAGGPLGAGGVSGVEERIFERDYNFCGATGCTYQLQYVAPLRTNPTFVSPPQNVVVTNSTFDPSASPCNNSPVFPVPPPQYLCNSTQGSFYVGGFDPDGDSLVYALDTCYDFPNAQHIYRPGFSPTAPMGPGWNVSLDPQSGWLNIIPTPGLYEVGFFSIRVSEYRNGVLLNESFRDFTLTARSCGINQNPWVETPAVLNNSGAANNSIVTTCAGDSLSFLLTTQDLDAGDSLTLIWLNPFSGGTFADSGNSSVQDTLYAHRPAGIFGFRPPTPGVYQAIFRVMDSHCRIPGIRDQVITIIAQPTGSAFAGVTTQCLTATFEAGSCGSGYSFQWSGTGGLSTNPLNNQPTLTHQYTAAGTYSWQVIMDSAGSPRDTVSGSVTVTSNPAALPGLVTGDTLILCGGAPANLTASSGYGGYLWSTGDTSQSITTSAPGQYSVFATDTFGCIFVDTFWVNAETPDILGTVMTSGWFVPLAYQKILLIRYDTIGGGTLTSVDTTYTDGGGVFKFCQLPPGTFYVKAIPDSGTYPNEMPTYADTAIFWNNAVPLDSNVVPWNGWITTRAGSNPGGPGFIGGLVSLGANKTHGPGDPVEDLTLFLRNAANGTVMGYAITDANGYFRFPNLPIGDYEVAADWPGVDEVNVPVIPLGTIAIRDSLDFRLHSTWLEWVQPTQNTPRDLPQFSITPNPTSGVLTMIPGSELEGRMELVSVNGKVVYESEIPSQRQQLNLRAMGLKAGIYLMRWTTPQGSRTYKIIFTD